MLILLPPSQGKTPPRRGRPVDLEALSYPELTACRRTMLDTLAAASMHGPAALGLPASMAAEVEANTQWATAHAAPAARVYTGVLYAAAGLNDLSGTAKRRAGRHVRIASALWGLLAPGDRIPAYRMSAATTLPGLPSAATHFAPALTRALADERGVVVDCRSADYVAFWRPPAGVPWLTVRIVEMRDGREVTISHSAKHTRGVFTRHLLTRTAAMPHTPAATLAAARELVGEALREARLGSPTRSGQRSLDLVLA